ncbi:SOUL heme-binding family protein [Asticcacaulis biprosthecium C19]|uniref:SOUL heme-binding family protein n=1 Tax=Asticcacaulis biprosthecium C19 TaxID=715226 RepID=F4QJI0_9CAUL|nr:heme-binding protein [Asticcacaulis biprosthecium]EGF93163.1 SOUL heme-binding family protein [Asticcacaulis biprosthecium C19]
MTKQWHKLWIALTVAIVAVFAGHAMAIEEPAFKTVRSDGDFALRDYDAMIAAEVRVEGDRNQAINSGFRLIADYIFGNNRQKSKVAMTAPVTQSAASEKIAMTAPVTQSGEGGAWTVRFIMPARYTMETLPEPNDARVKLVPVPAQRFAVVRFSGLAGESDIAERTTQLKAWVAAEKLVAEGEVTLARYDPPWTLWFLRRNELMIPVREAQRNNAAGGQ